MDVNDEVHIGARKALVGIALLLVIFFCLWKALLLPLPSPPMLPRPNFRLDVHFRPCKPF